MTSPPRLTHRAVLAVSLPVILSNVTVPLVGAVDTAVIGQLGDAAMLGGVAIGAVILGVLFWSFGFLKLSTSGLTAQAKGAGDGAEIAATLERALLAALGLGLAFVLLQAPIETAALWLMGGSPGVQRAAHTYVAWRMWSAPFVFVNYALLGWFIGLAETGRAFLLQLLINLVNMGASILFVLFLNWSVSGVGLAALLAEVTASIAGLALAAHELNSRGGRAPWPEVFATGPLRRLFSINVDIMIRSLLLMSAFASVAAFGARNGDLALAANGILLDLFNISAYFLDGFANAAETFVGQAIGARSPQRLREAVRISSQWAAVLSLVASAVLWFEGGRLIDLMTVSPEVREATRQFLPWCAVTPIAGVAAFQLDGIFIGATRGADMRNMMALSVVAYLVMVAVLMPYFGNHGLWAALITFFVVRGLALGSRFPALLRDALAGRPGEINAAD